MEMVLEVNVVELALKAIDKRFGSHCLFEHADVCFRQNEISFIMAPNGFGKTTVIRMLLGLTKVDSGKIINPYQHRDVFTIFDDLSFYPDLTGLDNVCIFTKCQTTKRQIEQIAEHYLPLSRLSQKVKDYSLGEGKKLSLIVWELLAPTLTITIMDEITNGLDYDTLLGLQQTISSKKSGFTILTGHQFDFYEKFIDRLYIICDHQIMEDTTWRQKGMAQAYENYFFTRKPTSAQK